jgi:hypothetical protein
MAERIVVVTVLYPAAVPFLGDFIADLNAQDDRSFSLVALLDGVAPGSLSGARMPVVERSASGTPAALRTAAINAAAMHGDILVFADADDRFRSDRVRVCRQSLAGWDALGHDFTPFTAGSPDLPPALHRAWDADRAMSALDLRDGTCLGLGASACRAAAAQAAAALVDPATEVFDWDFYAVLLHQGGAMRFLDLPLTRYRQHAGNQVGWGRTRDVVRGARIKADHYRRLSAWDPGYARLANGFARLALRLAADPGFRADYELRPAATRVGWWYDLTLPEES